MYQLNDDYPVEVKIRIFAGQVYAGAELGSWCLSPEKELYYSTCPHEAEFLSMFRLNGCLDYANTKEVWDKPVFLSDDLGMVWIAESMYVNWGSAPLCMIGPFFYNNVSIRHIDAQLRKNISSIPVRREMMRVLETVPVLTVATAYQYAAMMHFTLTDHMISSTDFYFQNDIVSDTELKDYYDEDVDESESVQEYGEDTAVNFEERLMLAISEGSPAYKELLSKASSYSDDMLTESGDSMRDAKNTLLIFNALACRAANKGGLPVRSAREIEKKYKEKIESCGNVGDTHEIMNRMVKEYVDSVAYTHENEQISKNIRECCDYIRNNVQKNLTVESIAAEMGYSTYYFSKKFNKEMGIKVTDYIKQVRIDQAKIALITTKRSIQDISDSLQFGTRNYFSKVFREIVGVTPAAYRERMGRSGF